MQEQADKLGNITRDKAKKSLGIAGGYIVCQREFILDTNLSAGAKVLFLIAWQLPKDFYLSETTMYSYLVNKGYTLTRKTVHQKLVELEKLGYITKVKRGYARVNGVTMPIYEYTLHEISIHLARDMLERVDVECQQGVAVDVEF